MNTKQKKKKNKKKLHNKAFTLVELLVAITIIGIIMVIALPSIRSLTGNQVKQKYDTYKSSIDQSARLYVETYGEDDFKNADGCILISLEKLINKGFAKDIQMDNKTCISDKSFVKIEKQKNRYTYTTYLSCMTKNTATEDSSMKNNDKTITTFGSGCIIP